MTPRPQQTPTAALPPRQHPGVEHLAAAVTPKSVNAETRTVDVLFFSSIDVQRFDYFRGEPYMLRFKPDGADLGLLNTGAPVFDNHNSFGGASAQKGVVEKAWRDGSEFKASLRFSRRDDVTPLWQDISDGIVQKFSMGVNLLEKRELEQEKGKLRVVEVTKWQPYEISTAPLPADNNTRTLSGTAQESYMATEKITMAEQLRQAEIQKLGKISNRPAAFIAEHLARGTDAEDFRQLAWDAMAEESEAVTIRTSHVDIGRSERDGFVERSGEALAARFMGVAPSDRAREFYGMSLPDLARRCLANAGRRAPNSAEAAVREALAMHSTSDFPLLLVEGSRRSLLAGYEAAVSPLKRLCKMATQPDFRARKTVRLSEQPELLHVRESGEITHGSRTESGEEYSLKTYGRIFALSFQGIVNDDLGAFTSLRDWGTSVSNLEADLIAGVILTNANLSDGTPLFDASRPNADQWLLDADGLSSGRKMLRETKGLDDRTYLNLPARFIAVGAANETESQKLVARITPTSTEDVQPIELEVLTDPRLGDSKYWIFASPDRAAVLEVCNLTGYEGPQIETREGWNILGLEVRAVHHVGVGAVGWRGGVEVTIGS